MTDTRTHPTDCECRLCVKVRKVAELRAAGQLPQVDERGPPMRRGKPVVSKGCKGCHRPRKS